MVQLILYSQQLVRNNKFSLLSTYEWDYTGSWVKSSGLITAPSAGGILSQLDVLTLGVEYEITYTISGSSGSASVILSDGITNIDTQSANGTYTVQFIATGTDIIFTAAASFSASISNVNVYSIPTLFKLDIDSDIPFKFSIDDVFNVDVRKAPRTGSFVIKGSSDVNKAFKHIYLINSDSSFNPNIKSKCTFKYKGIEFFSGTLCLDEINEKFDSQNGVIDIEYNVSAIEKVLDIYSILSDKTVRDLDFSEYDHLFNIKKVTDSWKGNITKNGSPYFSKTINNTFFVSSQSSVVVDGLNRIEFTFTANHNFIVGQEVYVNPDYTQCDISGGAGYLFDQVVHSIPASDKIVLECSDPCSAYPSASTPNVYSVSDEQFIGEGYYYPCVDNGTYIKNVYSSPFGSGILDVGQTYFIKYWDGSDDFTNIGASSNATGITFTATGTTPTLWVSSLVCKLRDTSITIGNDQINSKFGGGDNNLEATDSVWEVYDYIPYLFVREIIFKSFSYAGLQIDSDLFDDKIFRRLITTMSDPNTLIEGATLKMNDWTPSIKLTDILNSVLNIFNLSLTVKGSVAYFRKRSDSFDNTPIDWTSKLDISTPFKITPLNKDEAKIYHFKYSNSKDYINSLYSEDYGNIKNKNGLINIVDRNYSDYVINFVSDYRSETKDITISFEPSILAGGSSDFIYGIYGESTAIFPIHFSSNTGLTNITRPYSPKILIAGMRWNYKQSTNAIPMNLNFVSQTSSLELKDSWYYGYAAHFDNPFQVIPTHDLGFTTPLGVYFAEYLNCVKTFNYTIDLNDPLWDTNSLYNKYWSRYISRITNKSAKKISGRFKLSLIDIYSLDFTIPIIVSGMKLKLIKIENWYINSDGLCDVEFLITK